MAYSTIADDYAVIAVLSQSLPVALTCDQSKLGNDQPELITNGKAESLPSA